MTRKQEVQSRACWRAHADRWETEGKPPFSHHDDKKKNRHTKLMEAPRQQRWRQTDGSSRFHRELQNIFKNKLRNPFITTETDPTVKPRTEEGGGGGGGRRVTWVSKLAAGPWGRSGQWVEEEGRGRVEEGTWRGRLRSNPTADCDQPGRKRWRRSPERRRDVKRVEDKEKQCSQSELVQAEGSLVWQLWGNLLIGWEEKTSKITRSFRKRRTEPNMSLKFWRSFKTKHQTASLDFELWLWFWALQWLHSGVVNI